MPHLRVSQQGQAVRCLSATRRAKQWKRAQGSEGGLEAVPENDAWSLGHDCFGVHSTRVFLGHQRETLHTVDGEAFSRP